MLSYDLIGHDQLQTVRSVTCKILTVQGAEVVTCQAVSAAVLRHSCLIGRIKTPNLLTCSLQDARETFIPHLIIHHDTEILSLLLLLLLLLTSSPLPPTPQHTLVRHVNGG